MAFSLQKSMPTLLLALMISISSFPVSLLAQNCGCASNLCCSKFGFCGTGKAYCGPGCQSGPCDSSTPSGGGSGGAVSVADVVSQAFFDGITSKAAGSCPGKGFYTRDNFLNALNSYSGFASDSTADDSKREIAMFFAHVTHETTDLCHILEKDGNLADTYCDDTSSPEAAKYPCTPGKQYYGRGPLQLSWNYNYGPAGAANGFDGLNSPETVGTDGVITWKAALWYWMNSVHSVIGQGFGATIRAINGQVECNGGNAAQVQDRVQRYQSFCSQLGVSPGDNLSC